MGTKLKVAVNQLILNEKRIEGLEKKFECDYCCVVITRFFEIFT